MTYEEVMEEVRRFHDLARVSPEATVTVRTGDASATIVDQAVTTETDLIVMGTQGRGGSKRLLLGSVTETVLREAPCPVLTVPPHVGAVSSEVVTFKRILCPIDFSPSALQALGCALDLARQADGLVTLLHVVEWFAEEELQAPAHFNLPEFRRHMADDARLRLQALVAEESRTWCEIDPVIVLGRPYREILRVAAATPTNLIVMGAQGRGGVELALFGSTTQQVVRSSPCPVLTVRDIPRA
jgi:nucleotide-binding universal stress UspA family protein